MGGCGGRDEPRFLILSEDGSHDAVQTLEALAKKLFFQIEARLDQRRLSFVPPERERRSILSANKWRSRSQHDHRNKVELRQTIATHLLSGFVVFHVDGDTPYASRATSPLRGDLEREILVPVRSILQDKKPGLSSEIVDALLAKLLVFQPFYSIEAWTFYNTCKLRELCTPAERAMIEEWAANPHAIEEIHRPKEKLACRDTHNRILVESQFPTSTALATRKSFADTLQALRACSALVTCLQACTY